MAKILSNDPLKQAEACLSEDVLLAVSYHDPARKKWNYDVETTMKLLRKSFEPKARKLIWC